VQAVSVAIAPDDIVARHSEVAPGAREPLLVLEPLQGFLDQHGLGEGPIEPSPIGEGHSNVTYLISRGETELVLRRPPRGPLPPSAHDVLREARLLRALAATPVRVPKVLAVCDDPALIGCPFYVMERVRGEVIVDQVPSALDTPEQRCQIADELIEALVEIHAVDWEAAGLEGFGKPSGYLERQVRRFSGLWEHNRTREIPTVERVGRWLSEQMPTSGPSTIVHGDYRLGNTMFASQPPARLVAALDWEMATIGDPLADVGYMCMFWSEEGDSQDTLREQVGQVTSRQGFPSRAELIDRYEQRSGRSMQDLRWYTALALWKATVFMEGNYKRAVAGSTDDPHLKAFGEGVVELARQAERVAFDE
jgi:aminoglycoside phosphotransferase (APT) family kinase protein